MIYLGSDHRGFALKEKLKTKLTEWGFDYEDVGPFEYNKDDDYPIFAAAVGKAVALSLSKGNGAKGVLICGSGVGIDIAANKIDGVRAGTISEPEQARASVHDENLNVLSLSSDFLSEDKAIEIAKAFLEAKYAKEERYERRLEEIKDIEANN
ncbi:MAG: RpiB/LacA/LacB family sugar-phosphate isomerase [Candidatus Yanofskybacteria bacterium]|nr:RpiB/LacA/LacB family sugar-phosphate isomerase [Candidatus Yanofskybacteria bacterium]